ncbi:recombinase family protein [Peptostreptococcaceae bacterium OttesenSCG-928-C18]|nr:recombinase family protein [Peptostreptococcaceae bacterium OttesenSCG-928-C18]
MQNRNISVIPARTQVRVAEGGKPRTKLRVAAYCRVSTDDEEQLTSYEAQVSHYSSYIQQNPEWEFAGIYADESISGTNTKKRTDFKRLIDDCMAGKVDYIITKSVSRFARNTLDTLNYTRQLKEKNIPVFFEKENIISTDSKGELMLTIMASIAQEESRSTSQNVKMGISFRFQKGEMQINHNRFMGYTKDENKRLVIVPEEAEIVKRIYREYLEGASLLEIGRGLESDGILTAANKPKWRPESVKKILQNEKYIGDALLQKTYTVDFLSKKRVVNNGIVPQYYVENSHEAIIPRELYMQVQEEIVRRANLRTGKDGSKRVYSSRYALSSIVFCGECGDIYRRVHWNNRGKKSIVWRCVSRLEEKGSDCTSPTISESDLQNAVLKAINQIISERDEFMGILMNNIATVFGEKFDKDTDIIEHQLKELQNDLITQANSQEDYDTVVDEIYRLREVKQETLEHNAERHTKRQRVKEMEKFLKKQGSGLDEYDDKLVRKLVEQVTVHDKRLVIRFKSGIEIEVGL